MLNVKVNQIYVFLIILTKKLFIIECRCYNKHYFNIRLNNSGGFELYERKQKYS